MVQDPEPSGGGSEASRVDTSVPALVLDVGYGGLGVARSLGRMGVSVFATGARPTPALASRYWKTTRIWDFSSAPVHESLRFLLGQSQQIGSPAVLLPMSDATVAFVAENAEVLEERFLFARQAPGLIRSLIDKRGLYEWTRRMSLPTPKTIFPTSRRDVEAFVEATGLPVIAKGIDTRRPGGTSKTILHTARSVIDYHARAASAGESNLLIQEYIPGDDSAVWMFNGYFTRQSHCIAAFTGRKLRQYPAYAGVTSLGICERNTQVEEMASRFLSRLGYAGPVDVDYRYDPRDASYKILDVNPRIGATFRLFVDKNGLDVARTAYLDLTGQQVPAVVPADGRKWMLEEDLLTCLRYRKDGRLSLKAWAGSLRGVREAAWFARDDFAPLLARLWWGAKNINRSPARGIRISPRMTGPAESP